ncbi:MAG: hypothetical protein E4H36_05030, partial [Spirochaetales bacterium]
AAARGELQTITRLLDAGADVNAADTGGSTPLHQAAYFGRLEAVKLLLSKGAVIDSKDNGDQTPLSFAVRQGRAETARYLITNGADIHTQSSYNMTLLHWAASSGSVELVNMFLDYGLNLESKNRILETPLHSAASAGRTEVIRVLLSRGADPAVKSKSGTPLEYAKRNFKNTTAEELLQEALNLSVERLSDVDLSTSLTSGNHLEDFVLVKGGWFDMGDVFGDGNADEKPVHRVFVDDFYISKFEVTKRQWMFIMGGLQDYSTYKSMEGSVGMYPITSMGWLDVQEFIEKLNEITGKSFRLPTEAEWEYAARSGGRREKWAGTSNEALLPGYSILLGTGSRQDIGIDGIDPVGSKKPNALGLYDMTGNVWEFTGDWYDAEYYAKSGTTNPAGPEDLNVEYRFKNRVVRGGSYGDTPSQARVTRRAGVVQFDFGSRIGFRLVHPANK